MMEKVSTEVNLILEMVVMVAMTMTVTINPGDIGEGLFWSQRKLLSKHEMMSYVLSAVYLNESENQDLMSCF
jgi:hypothetical protein